ncbi:MAG: hypothetical protein CMA02_05625 [Euryarchaeota archaeon]|nr:hypothetical protein [Euryarchaeota archaeon]
MILLFYCKQRNKAQIVFLRLGARNSNVSSDAKVAAFIVNWNNAEETIKSYKSLSDHFDRNDIFVVDNGSSNEDLDLLQSKLGNSNLIISEANLGYPGGANLALSRILELDYEMALSLNNDATIDSKSIELLISALKENPEIGMISPWVVYTDTGKIWFKGGWFSPWLGMTSHPGKGSKMPENRSRRPIDSDYLCGCSILFRLEMLLDTGLLEEKYFIYSEDLDHSLRAKKKKWRICTLPRAIVKHGVSKSTGSNSTKHFSKIRAYYYSRNSVLSIYWNEESKLRKIFALASQLFIVFPLSLIRMIFEGSIKYLPDYIRGMTDGFRGKYGRMDG